MADDLPGEMIVKTRDEWREGYLRSYRLRDPDADTARDTQPWVDASTLSDQLVILSEDARRIGANTVLSTKRGKALDEAGKLLNVYRAEESGGSGWVQVSAAATGTTIQRDDELVEPNSGLRFKCALTGTYQDGDPAPVIGIDTGSSTNLDGETVLQWSAPRPGCGPTAKVITQSDGAGLSGGRESETDAEYLARLIDAKANQAASGNDAEYQRLTEETRGHGVLVQKAFTWPGIEGPGSTALAFTMKPARPGASRRPNGVQIDTVYAYVVGKMPADDSAYKVALLQQLTTVELDVQWTPEASGWIDSVPWPPRYDANPSGSAGTVIVSAATDATHFTLATYNGDYTNVAQPAVGQTIALFDLAKGKFRAKRIGEIAGAGPWVVTCDTANGASDTSYTPVAQQVVSPWSDSLDDLVPGILAAFDGLGPGEQFSEPAGTLFDAGRRRRRSPTSPKQWPHVLTRKALGKAFDVPSVEDGDVAVGADTTTTIGVPGTSAYIQELGDLAAFPL